MWSRARIEAATAGDISLFQYQEGQAGPGIANATAIDTNMPAAGNLPAMHEMLIYSFQIIPDEILNAASTTGGFSGGAADWMGETSVIAAMQKWNTIYASTLFQFRIEQSKNYVEGRIDHFPAGGGPHIEHTDATTASDSYDVNYIHTNGIQSWEATRRLAMPVYIGGLETFRGIIRFPRGQLDFDGGPIDWTQGFGLTVRMTGPRRRPSL